MQPMSHQDWKNHVLRRMIAWIEERFACEVYWLEQTGSPNGFVEYRNGKHIIYLLADPECNDLATLIDILAHEAGHVRYNQEWMAAGRTYSEIVHRTRVKLAAFDQLLSQGIITDEEYDRLYAAIEEEWQSNQASEEIAGQLWQIAKAGHVEKSSESCI